MDEEFEDDIGLDNDDNFGDLLGDDLDGMDIDGFSEPPPPKNAREAISRSITDVGSSFVSEFTDDVGEAAKTTLKHAVPKSISSEVGQLADIHDTATEEIEKATSEIKKAGRETHKAIKGLLPEGNETIDNAMNKIGEWLGVEDDEASKQESEESIRNAQIQAELTATMGEKQDEAMIQQQIASQIAANNSKNEQQLLNANYAETTRVRTFLNDVAGSYYRKNLEIQFRQMYLQKESVDVLKAGFDTFKNQFESIIRNTSLPDIVKTKTSETFKEDLKRKAFGSLTDSVFKNNPFVETVSKNIKDKVSDIKDSIVGGLEETNGMLNMVGGDVPGMSLLSLLGMMGAETVKEKVGNKIGKLAAGSETGNKWLAKFKNAFGDVSNTIEDATSGTMLEGAGNFVSDIFNTKKRNNFSIEKEDHREAHLFDNRVHSAIVKVIPGLLSKIYSELKTTRNFNLSQSERKKADKYSKDNELIYNYDNNTFETRNEKVTNLKAKLVSRAEKSVGVGTEKLLGILSDDSIGELDLNLFGPDGKRDVRNAITEYMSKTNADLRPEEFLKNITKRIKNDTARSMWNKAVKKTIKYAEEKDHKILDPISSAIKQIRYNMPNTSDIARELYDSGHQDIATDMGLSKYDELSGNIITDNDMYLKTAKDAVSNMNQTNINKQYKLDSEVEKYKKLASRLSDKSKNGKYRGLDSSDKKLLRKYKENFISKGLDWETEFNKYGLLTKGFAKGGYTGDGVKYDPAGIVHKGEYVINKEDLKDLVKDVKNDDQKSILSSVGKIVGDIKDKTNVTNLKKQATAGYNTIKEKGSSLGSEVSKSFNTVVTYFKDVISDFKTNIDKDKTVKDATIESLSSIATTFKGIEVDFSQFIDFKNELKDSIVNSDTYKNINKKYNSIKTNVTSSDTYKNAVSKVDQAKGIVEDVNTKVLKASLTTEEKRILKKRYRHFRRQYKTYDDFVNDIGLKIIREYREKKGLAGIYTDQAKTSTKHAINKVMETKDSVISNVSDTVNNVKDNITGSDKYKSLMETKDKFLNAKTMKERFNAIREAIANPNLINMEDLVQEDPKAEETLRAEFFASDEFKNSEIDNFSLWLKITKGINLETGKNKLLDMLSKYRKFLSLDPMRKKMDKLADELKQELWGKITGTGLKELTLEEEKAMRDIFFASDEFKSGNVTDFEVWLKSYGYRKNGTGIFGRMKKALSVKNLLKKTRALDKKIFKGTTSLIGKGIKGTAGAVVRSPLTAVKLAGATIKGTGKVIKGIGTAGGIVNKTAGVIGSGLGLAGSGINAVGSKVNTLTGGNEESSLLGRTLWGAAKLGLKYNPYSIGARAILGASKSAVGSIGDLAGINTTNKMKAIVKIKDITSGKIFSKDPDKIKIEKGDSIETINAKKDAIMIATMKKLAKSLAPKKKVLGDRDGDGIRDGSWKERLSKTFKDKKTKVKDKIKNIGSKIVSGAKSLINPTTVILGIMGIMKLTGVTLGDIKDTLVGVYDFMKPIFTGIWNILKFVGKGISNTVTYLKKAFYYIKNLPNNISIYLRRALSHLPFMHGLAPSKKELEIQKLKNNGEYYGDDTEDYEEGSSTGHDVGMAVGAGIAAYAGKKVYNGARRVYRAGKAVTNGVIKTKNFLTGNKTATPKVKPKVSSEASKLAKNSKGLISKVKSFLSRIKTKVIKKLGVKGGAKVLGKLASRTVPFLGAAMLAYDGVKIGYDMIHNGTPFKNAVSKQILGFDIFDDNSVAVDEDGNPIQPDIPKAKIEQTKIMHKENEKLKKENKEVNKTKTKNKETKVKVKDKDSVKDYSTHINAVAGGINRSVNIQSQMLSVLHDINAILNKQHDHITKNANNKEINTKKEKQTEVLHQHQPAMALARNTFE